MSRKLLEVHSLLDKELDRLGDTGESTRDIATTFVDVNEASVAADLWREVKIVGIIQLLNDRRKIHRAVKGSKSDTPDLFGEFKIGPSIVVVRTHEEGKGVVEKNKDVPLLTLPEATDFIARHSQQRKTDNKRMAEWRRMVRRAAPFMTREGMTLEEGLRLAAAARAAKRKRKGS